MTKYLFSLLLMASAGVLESGAVTFESQSAGTLSTAFTDPSGVLVLKVTGEVDASDLFYIESSMPSLSSLDLSEARIVAYSGKALNGSSQYPANTIPAGTFARMGFTSVALPATTGLVIGDAAFAGTGLENLTLSTPDATVGAGAFSACPKLANVSISASTTLDTHAFANCGALTEVSLAGVKELAPAAFNGCTSLSTVSGNTSISKIGKQAFAGCSGLTEFEFSTALTEISEGAFEGSGLIQVDLSGSKSLKSLGGWAFASCEGLTTVILPAELGTIGEGAFFHCPALTDITYPNKATSIPAYAFSGSSKLDPAHVVQGSVTRIGDYALKDNGAYGVNLPEGLEYIGTGAMAGMKDLKAVYAQNLTSVPELGENVWEGVDQPNVGLYVDPKMSDEFEAADQWKDFKFMVSTDLNDVTAPEGITAPKLEGRFVGTDLCLRSRGAEISRVDVYLTSGSLVISEMPGQNEVSIPTSHIGASIFIVECTLSDGSRAALKMLRK